RFNRRLQLPHERPHRKLTTAPLFGNHSYRCRYTTPIHHPILKSLVLSDFDAAALTRRRITRQSLQKTPFTGSRVGTRKPPAKPGPEKISLARLPVTGSEIFGREEDITYLDRAWANKDINVVTIVAWAGGREVDTGQPVASRDGS